MTQNRTTFRGIKLVVALAFTVLLIPVLYIQWSPRMNVEIVPNIFMYHKKTDIRLSKPLTISNFSNKLIFVGPARVPNVPEELFNKPRVRKYFIYDCSKGLCGGLADRQEGIVGAYIISQLLRRDFKVRMLVPCDIGTHLQDNLIDWTINRDFGKGLTHIEYKRLDHSAWALRKQIANGLDLEKEFPYDVTHFNVNQEMVKYLMQHPMYGTLKWARNKTAADIYNIVLRRIFKMRPHIQEKFDRFQVSARSEGRQLVCAHVRIGANPTIPNDEPRPVNLTVVWNFLRQFNNSVRYSIFVATDSDAVRKDVKHLFPDVIKDIGGNIVHVDRDRHTKKYACAGFGKVILDQQTLSTCDISFMTDSGLGRIAAMLRGTDKGLFCMHRNITYKRCSFSDKGFFPSYW